MLRYFEANYIRIILKVECSCLLVRDLRLLILHDGSLHSKDSEHDAECNWRVVYEFLIVLQQVHLQAKAYDSDEWNCHLRMD